MFAYFVSVAPKVFLSFGQNLVPEDIEEGNDVYFECEVHSNPKVYKIIWLHNVSNVQVKNVKKCS